MTRFIVTVLSVLIANSALAGTITVFKGGEWACTGAFRGKEDGDKNPFPDGDGYTLKYEWVGETAENSRQVLTYKDGRVLNMVRNNSGYHVNDGGTFKLVYDAAYANIDPLNDDYSKIEWSLAVGIAQGRYIGMDFTCEGKAELVQKPFKRFTCVTDEEIFEGKERAQYTMKFKVANYEDPALVNVMYDNDDDLAIKVTPEDYVVNSLNENLSVNVAKNGDLVLDGDSDGVYWSRLRLAKAEGYKKGTLSFEGEFRGNGGEDKMSVGVTCKVRN
ncbi:MAG: hypothetical protein KF767_10325 [Bdellovibrionaceae bacterium]|nr:hypothetical protein [Pseudobdellovibrionaceae bacterium]